MKWLDWLLTFRHRRSERAGSKVVAIPWKDMRTGEPTGVVSYLDTDTGECVSGPGSYKVPEEPVKTDREAWHERQRYQPQPIWLVRPWTPPGTVVTDTRGRTYLVVSHKHRNKQTSYNSGIIRVNPDRLRVARAAAVRITQ